jgi:hypothetical protein
MLRPHRCIDRVKPTLNSSAAQSCQLIYWFVYIQYAKWSAAARGADPGCAKSEHFYTDPWAQNIFRNYLATLTARVNSFTGVMYRCPENGQSSTAHATTLAGKGVVDRHTMSRSSRLLCTHCCCI